MVRLEVNIHETTQRALRWAELERDMSPQMVIECGVWLLQLLQNSVETSLIHEDGTVEYIDSISIEPPGEEYGF